MCRPVEDKPAVVDQRGCGEPVDGSDHAGIVREDQSIECVSGGWASQEDQRLQGSEGTSPARDDETVGGGIGTQAEEDRNFTNEPKSEDVARAHNRLRLLRLRWKWMTFRDLTSPKMLSSRRTETEGQPRLREVEKCWWRAGGEVDGPRAESSAVETGCQVDDAQASGVAMRSPASESSDRRERLAVELRKSTGGSWSGNGGGLRRRGSIGGKSSGKSIKSSVRER